MPQQLQEKQLLAQLQKIGLHETDAKVYLASIHLGACTINQLTKHTKINRITVHDSTKRLVQKWLLLETFSGKKRLVFPQQISNLQHIVDLKKSELDTLQHEVSTTIHLLQSLHLQSTYLPHIRIAKWRAGIQQMLHEIKEHKTTKISIISDSWHFDELITGHFLDNLETKKHTVDIILPAGFEHFIFSAHAKGVSIRSRTLADTIQRKWGMTIRWDTVALHAYEWVYITTTLIENKAIVAMMKSSFSAIWGQCEK